MGDEQGPAEHDRGPPFRTPGKNWTARQYLALFNDGPVHGMRPRRPGDRGNLPEREQAVARLHQVLAKEVGLRSYTRGPPGLGDQRCHFSGRWNLSSRDAEGFSRL